MYFNYTVISFFVPETLHVILSITGFLHILTPTSDSYVSFNSECLKNGPVSIFH